MQPKTRLMNVLSMALGLLLVACAAPAVDAQKEEPAHLVTVEGSDLKQVILTEKAFERLAIETTFIREEMASRTRTVGGEVIQITDMGTAWVRVRLNASDLNQVDKSQAAFVQPLDDEQNETVEEEDGWEAETHDPSDMFADGAEDDPAAGTLYYQIATNDQPLFLGQRVWVRLTLLGGATLRKIVPYAAVIYDIHGQTWVYTNPAPLTFVRQPITIDYIEGNLAFLLDGPAADTTVVITGGAELYGTETGVSK